MDYKPPYRLLILNYLMQGPNYAYELTKRIMLDSEGILKFSFGRLYPILVDMEDAGLVTRKNVEANGKLLGYYTITPAGREVYTVERLNWSIFAETVSEIVSLVPLSEGGA